MGGLWVLIVAGLGGTVAVAQDEPQKPWLLFLDNQSTSQCDVVNADNGELVVLQGSGEMVIVSGTDVTLSDLIVDVDGFVSFEGEPAGQIGFALDGDGLRTLWWTSLTGQVVRVNGFTGEPSFTSNFPEEYNDVPCDACDFWDDPEVCPAPTPPIFSLCGAGLPFLMPLMLAGLVSLRRCRRPA